MKTEPITTAEQAIRAIADGKVVEFRAVIGPRHGSWHRVGSPVMLVKDAVKLFDDLLRFGEVRARD